MFLSRKDDGRSLRGRNHTVMGKLSQLFSPNVLEHRKTFQRRGPRSSAFCSDVIIIDTGSVGRKILLLEQNRQRSYEEGDRNSRMAFVANRFNLRGTT